MRRRFINLTKESNISFDYNNYLTIEALEDGLSVMFEKDIEYGIDGVGWTYLPKGDSTPIINAGQTISFRSRLIPEAYKGVGTFSISKLCNLVGNCMSLIFGDNAVNNKDLTNYPYVFSYLFELCDIKHVSQTFLPATTLANHCYFFMFGRCTSLTTAPALPATTLADSCYYSMFKYCSSLTITPELPATTLADSCYHDMFTGCTSLVKISLNLPATILANKCCYSMFGDCTNLVDASLLKLPATTLADSCYHDMFTRCVSLKKAPKLPATNLAKSCYLSMFNNCKKLTTAPELPATELVELCYLDMFFGCERLNYVKMLAIDISATKCLEYWIYGYIVQSEGTFVVNKDATWDTTPGALGHNGIPKGWTVITEEESGG